VPFESIALLVMLGAIIAVMTVAAFWRPQ